MTAVLVVLAEVAACVGLGAAVLRMLGLGRELGGGERLAWAFAVGFGTLGWLMFPMGATGFLGRPALAGLLAIGAVGLIFLGRSRPALPAPPVGWAGWLAATAIAVAFALGLAQALAPPTDADTLAYHFALPRDFVAEGRIVFVPRAVDAAVPLLVEMTYVPALALGGERALTLWTFVSGWALVYLFHATCRRHLDRRWSLAASAVLATTPAVVYGAGSGQVEVRIALFALPAALAAARALAGGGPRQAALAGLMAGFYAASKYLGLLFVAAVGVVLLARRGWLGRGVAFAAAAVVAGVQWYGWNAYHTGDPVFPLLFSWLGAADGTWDAAHAQGLEHTFFGGELALPVDPWGLVSYPFRATFGGASAFESGRTGLGAMALALLPFALAGAWRARRRLVTSPLAPVAAAALLYYLFWFLSASSQRVRHLLPIYPLVLVCVAVAAARWCDRPWRLRPVVAAVALTLSIQIAGAGLFGLGFVRHLVAGEDREAFLARTVSQYALADWINRNLGSGDRVALAERQLLHLIRVPAYLAHPVHQALLDVRPEAADASRFLAQARALGITHVVAPAAGTPDDTALGRLATDLVRRGCARPLATVATRKFASRTLPALVQAERPLDVLALDAGPCP